MSEDLFSDACLPCPNPDEIPALFALAKSADATLGNEARGKVFAYLLRTHEPFIRLHARKDFGNGLSTQDLALTVVREMLPTLDRYECYDHLRNVFQHKIANRAMDQMRRCIRSKVAIQELTDTLDEQDSSSHTAELARVDLVEKILEALQAHNADWAAVVKLRLLATVGHDATFAAIGQALEVPAATAWTWFKNAGKWLALRFPDLESLLLEFDS